MTVKSDIDDEDDIAGQKRQPKSSTRNGGLNKNCVKS
jgi:hypothetical protein